MEQLEGKIQYHLEELGVHRRIRLKLILQKEHEMMRTDLVLLGKETSG